MSPAGLWARLRGRRGAPAVPGAPAHYDEWLPLLRRLRSGEPDEALLALLAEGTLAGGNAELELFADELARTLDAMLADACRSFRRGLEIYTAQGDGDALLRQFRRLRRRLEACLFFEALAFLPDAKKRALGGQVRQYALAYWQNAVAAVGQAAAEAPALEDTLYRLRRIEPFAAREEETL